MTLSTPRTSTSLPSSSEASKKRRRAISTADKLEIRRYFFDKAHNKRPTLKALQEWYAQKHPHVPKLHISSISEIISDKYDTLDDDCTTKKRVVGASRLRQANHPDLEAALYQFQLRMTRKGAAITGDILKEMAGQIWDKLPQYAETERPKFSNGWLEAFKKRHNVYRRIRHGEAAQVDREALEEQLKKLHLICEEYNLRDIYNMDETGLFWKAMPDRTLSSETVIGGKRAKSRITANFCVNADGSDKLPIWFIGQYNKPHCFRGININNFDMIWKSNKKAWMTGAIFSEWLIWFNRRMINRKVLLLIDGFSAHQTGIDLTDDLNHALTNVRIEFLPANATSVCQPLDQGIIRTWKAYYRQRWLRFMISHFEEDKDPDKNMHVLQAIRWGIAAWNQDVTNVVIANCWLKSRVIGPKYGPITRSIAIQNGWEEAIAQNDAQMRNTYTEIGDSIQLLQNQERIRTAINISAFLNPTDEDVNDEEDDILTHVVDSYAEGDRAEETDEEPAEVIPIKQSDAMEAVRLLQAYEEQQEDGDSEILRQLDQMEFAIRRRMVSKLQQTEITSYFS